MAILRNIDVLVPEYMNEFVCIASRCEDNCCIGWQVEIDKKSYKEYRNCRDSSIKDDLKEHVSRNKNSKTDKDYALIKLKDNACPFLDEKKLCNIQKKIGESYLSVTCKTYPRRINIVNDVVEKSASISCPEIARLALLNEKGMGFVRFKDDVDKNNVQGAIIDSKKSVKLGNSRHYFEDLRIFTIDILQNRNYELWERLILMGLFYSKLETYIKEERLNEIPNLIELYAENIDNHAYREELKNIPTNKMIQFKMIKEIIDERFSMGLTSPRYKECLYETLHGLGIVDTNTDLDIESIFEKTSDIHYNSLLKDKEYIMENYLVNYVFKNLLPIDVEDKVFNRYVMLVVNYAMIKLHLLGISNFHKEKFDIDHVIKLYQSYSKTVEHNRLFLQNIINLIEENDMNTMAYMAILIKE